MSFSSSDLFDDRSYGAHTMPLRLYILVLSFFIAGGLLLSSLASKFTYGMKMSWPLLLGTFAIAIVGILIAVHSDNWLISLFGYLLVVLSMGAMIGPYVALFTLASVAKIFVVTMTVTVVIGVAGAIYPKSVESWGGFLLTGLTVLIVSQFAVLLLPLFGFPAEDAMRALDWVGVFLFSGYVFYDMNRAVHMDYTMDNAVDNAVALYLDIINLFIRLLSIFGDRKSSD